MDGQLRPTDGRHPRLSSEAARAISREVRVALTPEDVARLAPAPPVDPAVQEAYLKGRYFLDQHTEEGEGKSREYFQRAIDEDPGSALGYAGLAAYYTRRNEPSKAKAAALRALELDETQVEAHVALAKIAIHHDWNWEAADRELRRALELDPVNPDAHRVSGTLLYVKGRVDEAIERCKAALELDPLSPGLNDYLISAYAAARRYDETIALCRRTLEMYPDRTWTRSWLGYAYLGKGAHAEAIAELERAVATSGGSSGGGCSTGGVTLARAYALSGRRTKPGASWRTAVPWVKQPSTSPWARGKKRSRPWKKPSTPVRQQSSGSRRTPIRQPALGSPLPGPARTVEPARLSDARARSESGSEPTGGRSGGRPAR